MPNRHTFLIKPIKELIALYFDKSVPSIDPFAGFHSPATVTNDINPLAPTTHHMDALEFLESQREENPSPIHHLGFFDPPYSITQAVAKYKMHIHDPKHNTGNKAYWAKCKTILGELIIPNGYVIHCGWNSGGLGLKRGFKLLKVLLVPHGGGRNDTIVTVEQKNPVCGQII
jgi:hypothetical protein